MSRGEGGDYLRAETETIETTRQTEINTSSVADTATEVEAGTVTATETGLAR